MAYYYADLAIFWLTLGIIYGALGLALLLMSTAGYLINRTYKNKIEEYKQDNFKHTAYDKTWPDTFNRWFNTPLCVFQFGLLILWIYAWRHLLT